MSPGDVQLSLSPPVTLGAGTWWVSVQARLDYGSSSDTRQWFWHHRSVQTYQGAAWRNPGDLWQMGCPAWSRRGVCQGSAAVPGRAVPPARHGRSGDRPAPPAPVAMPRADGRGEDSGPRGDADPPRPLPRGTGRPQALRAPQARQGSRPEPACRPVAGAGLARQPRRRAPLGPFDRRGRELVQRPEHDAGQRERLRPGGKTRFGIATTRIPADEPSGSRSRSPRSRRSGSAATSSRAAASRYDVRAPACRAPLPPRKRSPGRAPVFR